MTGVAVMSGVSSIWWDLIKPTRSLTKPAVVFVTTHSVVLSIFPSYQDPLAPAAGCEVQRDRCEVVHSIRVNGASPGSNRVLMDARPLQGASSLRGMGRYVRSLLGALLAEGFGGQLALLMDGGQALPELPGGDYVVYTVRRRYRGRLAPYEDAVALPRDLQRIQPRLFHGTTLSLPGRLVGPSVVTLHDLIPWALGGRHMLGERVRYRVGRGMLCQASLVITPSESVAADAVRLAGVRRERIRVIPEGVSERLQRVAGVDASRWGIHKPFLLFLGALDARKNPSHLLQAWKVAREQGADCELVLAGAAGRQAPSSMEGALRLGYLPDDELAALLSCAGCLLFPSSYEGFGLPVLEAMVCGCPVVTYRNSSLPEVAGDVATLVPDGDPDALGRAAAAYLLDPELSGRTREAGIRWARRFTWRKAARETLAAYRDVAARAGIISRPEVI
jgi:glycosyltransferase involved in cell wall biosynthesis